tara:strand:+ start:2111 stop:2623 length:513 start_codon:yes stop_codon:yes gene_type:complete
MIDYKTYEELPKRVQYFVGTIQNYGHTDIRSFESPCKFFGQNSFGCKVWIDSEEMVQGKIPYRFQVQEIVTQGTIKDLFGIEHLSIVVCYKNKQQLGKKFLPELKKRLKESSDGKYVHSVRFDINNKFTDPQVYVVLRRNSDMNSWGIIKNIFEEFKIEKGYPYLDVKIS